MQLMFHHSQGAWIRAAAAVNILSEGGVTKPWVPAIELRAPPTKITAQPVPRSLRRDTAGKCGKIAIIRT